MRRKPSFIVAMSVALIAIICVSCHRKPEPTPPQTGTSINNSSFTSEPIVVNGEETGYAISYRSWIVPGTDAQGHKAPVPPSNSRGDKSVTSQGDTISVILHDRLYHVDTVGYVTTWDPARYQAGSYSCHWDRYGMPRPQENYVIITDSTAILRIQFAEFSFSYRLDFEVARYNNGIINKTMPYYSLIVFDQGISGELETMETISRNDSVFARKVLRHSIKVVIANKIYILQARVVLHRYLPEANPNRFITRSEVISETIPTEIIQDNDYDDLALHYPYECKIKRYYSDGSTEISNINLSELFFVSNSVGYTWIEQDHSASCENVDAYSYKRIELVPDGTEETIEIDDFAKIKTVKKHYYVYFNGTDRFFSDNTMKDIFCSYDDGYTLWEKNFIPSMEYTRTEKVCEDWCVLLNMFFNVSVGQAQREFHMTGLLIRTYQNQ